MVDTLHEAFTRAYEGARRLDYAAAREPGWFRTATFKRKLADELPARLGTFVFDEALAVRAPRLLLLDDDNSLRISVRRSTGLSRAMARKRTAPNPGLFPASELELERSNTIDLAALAWDWPQRDDDGELTGPWPLSFLMAQPDHTLDEGRWAFSLPLVVGTTLAEHVEAFSPEDEPLIFLDAEDEDEGKESAG
ncbi:hypothetical protein QM787_04180 [Rhodococcus ruber]|uniref:Uncharacterized protein n=1 Tax=Rhodococcus ruber TaxID=1830 RepID=A0A098BVT8_9NOCA|nr:hypothetical protein [Rhodococcus ruber]MCD2127698.1 hypothetical protein [Rhodococcus ruber]MCZ4504356.1 hypothetical protein [Rhodococcus ruber]MCZ4529408.1 hypothetical protein [Rhodococcus ruber]MCZ4621017.1 hypothetical protein [Rhodococcus ruber]MDI9967041.1 hypothetical protein [Rhodococcus ruber]